jgi:hypothetical protein
MRRAVYLLVLTFGYPQAWLAKGYREGTSLERVLIWPTWAVFRALFFIAYHAHRRLA